MPGLTLIVLKAYESHKSKKLSKRLDKQNKKLQKKISELESRVEEAQNNIYHKKDAGWRDDWQKTENVKLGLYSLEDELAVPVVEGKARERIQVYERLNDKASDLSNLIKPLEKAVNEFDKKELSAISDYLGTITSVYQKLKKEEVGIGDELQGFEERNPGTKLSESVKELRLYRFALTGPETKALMYLNSVYSKINASVPAVFEFKVEGEPSKWKTKLDEKSLTVSGKYKRHWFSRPSLVLNCQYSEKAPEMKKILDKAKKSQEKKQYRIECIVMDETPEQLASTINDFSNSRMALYSFELNGNGRGIGNLHFNQSVAAVNRFSRYFDPNSKQTFYNFPI